jgi:curved DNA-binding protein CbpA
VANPTHLEKLCEGPKAWNAWRAANPNIVPDLTDITLGLAQRQLGPSNGGPVDLHLADLENASLPYATLSGADLEGARLVGADLTHARLDHAKLSGADLTDAILDQSDLTGAVLDQAVLFGTQLSNTRNLTAMQLERAYGDIDTRLPANLMPPEAWFAGVDNGGEDDDYAGWGEVPNQQPQRNLYELLGVSQDARQDEIRTAFRTLVKTLHPDLNPGNKEALETFKEVTIGYRILSDKMKRKRYDRGEIDGDGRVNPEFEARRLYRRAAYRYYAVAIGSFVLVVGALAAVWHTVLSGSSPQGSVATISQPKQGERLGAQAPGEAMPARNGQNADLDPVTKPDASPPFGADGPAGGGARQPEGESKEPEKPDQKPAAMRTSGKGGLRSTDAQNSRPVSRSYQQAAGPTAPSAPDEWSVAAIIQASAPERGPPGGGELLGLAPAGDRLSGPAQQPIARDIVSQVLRARAFQQALGKPRRSVAAGEFTELPQRRSGTAGSGARPYTVKRSTTAQRKPQSRPPTRSQATAANTSFETQRWGE